MGFLDKIKDAFASSPRAQFLGDDGTLIVLHAESIERKTAQAAAAFGLETVRAELSAAADVLTIASEDFEWVIPVGKKAAQANAAALFVNKVNMAASGPDYSVATFVHGK